MENQANPVRQQYEALPFPQRDPEDEARRLVSTGLDYLGKIAHFCFGGTLDLSRPFRVLVAGGGTGDASIFLAEQLRNMRNATVTHLDLSSASIDVAKRRAEKRGLSNITWIRESLLQIDERSLGEFDYINCAGVLHHLPDPGAGLRRLKSVLADGGGMGLMVYGRYGRASVYEVQQLLRTIGVDDASHEQKIRYARGALKSLSPLHAHIRGWPDGPPVGRMDDANIFDTYLHPQDVAYSVPELYEFIEGEGLHIAGFADFDLGQPVLRIEYDPATYIEDEELLAKVRRLSTKDQQAVAELMNGTISLHSLYASARTDTAASFAALDHVPYFYSDMAVDLARSFVHSPSTTLELRCKKSVHVNLSQGMRKFLAHVDARRTTGEILHLIANADTPVAANDVFTRLLPEFKLLNSINVLFLRSETTMPFAFVTQMARQPTDYTA